MNTYREYSIDGLTLIGKGGTGECYQIDDDKILKLYYEEFPEEWVLREKHCAKKALIALIPTAISYELAKVGDRRGIVYEMIKARTMSQCICREPGKLEKYAEKYAVLAKTIHSAKGDAAEFDRGTAALHKALVHVNYLSESGMRDLTDFMDSLDRCDTYIHGDFHPNNILVKNDELILIDMGGLAVGSPVIDLATLYFCMFCSPEALQEGPSPYTGMTNDQHQRPWDTFITHYYGVPSYAAAKETIPEAAMIEDVALLKEMSFVQLYGHRYDPAYSENIRKKAIARWERDT